MNNPFKLFPWIFSSALLVSCGGSQTDTAAIRVSCLGSACSAGQIENFLNTSAQVWTYQNTGDTAVSLDLNFSNLAKGQELAYVFGNGYSATGNALPNMGQASNTDGSAGKTTVGASSQPELTVIDTLQEEQDEWRQRQQVREADLARTLRPRFSVAPAQAAGFAAPSATIARANAFAVATGTQRTWVDYSVEQPKSYATTSRSSCLAANGRQVVVWADESSITSGTVSKTTITAIEATLCGVNGGVSRMSRLIGNVWGTAIDSRLIQDSSNSLQDINVVIISAGKDQPWAGYFSGADTVKKSTRPDTNEALAFYVNANQMATDLSYTQSVLIHELTHMVYWYERVVRRDAMPNDTWLDEMAALMSEDIITPSLVSDANGQPYRPILSTRLPAYLNSGGGLNLVAWAPLAKASPYYSMAATFGAYLNRQYGLAIYKGLINDCTAITDSWSCLDTVIKNNGGKGVDEEFNYFGLTVFGLVSGNGPSARFSFPTRTEGGYTLAGIDLPAFSKYRPSKSPNIASWSPGTNSFFVESAKVSIFSFTRGGIVVPARSRLSVVIRQASGS